MSEHVVIDLFDCKADMLVHQTNATATRAKGLSSAMFHRFPYSNVYGSRKYGQIDKLGHIHTRTPAEGQSGPTVVACMAQKYPGGPYRMSDGTLQRRQWFQQCLDNLMLHHVAHDHTKVIAFPYKIGCGLAKGDWTVYKGMIDEFARHVRARVLICELPA